MQGADRVSDDGLRLIMAFEGFRATVYRCPAGVATQGYGHTAAAGGEPLGGTWSREKAARVLREDLARVYVPAVLAVLQRPATQGQLDAMVSLAFNIGAGAFARSSVLKHHNRGQPEQAAGAFALWVKATVDGQRQRVLGLVRRRASEALAYQGVVDRDFDGRRDADDAVYGTMPQAVEPARERVGRTGTLRGIQVATAGVGVTQTAAPAAETVKAAADQLAPAAGLPGVGTMISALTVLGVLLTLGGLAYAAWRRWDDAGRPLPRALRWLRRRA